MENEIQPNNDPALPVKHTTVIPVINRSKIKIFIILGLIIVAGSVFFVMQSGKKPITERKTEIRQQVQIPAQKVVSTTANWKTFLSDDKTISFNYPFGWILEAKSTTLEIHGKKYSAKLIKGGIPLTEEEQKAHGFINFTLLYLTSPDFEDFTLDNLYENFVLNITVKENVDFNKDIVLDNKMTAREAGYGCQEYCRDILFRHNNTIFESSINPVTQANLSTLRQILSTFKFIN